MLLGDAADAFCIQTSPEKEKTQQVRECFHPWKLSSKDAYHLHANTLTQLW